MSGEQGNDVWMPTSAADRAAIQDQLEKLLAADPGARALAAPLTHSEPSPGRGGDSAAEATPRARHRGLLPGECDVAEALSFFAAP